MGMFDNVILKGVHCPLCGQQVEDFQTKDGPCMLSTYVAGKRYKDLERYRYLDVYTHCIHRLRHNKDSPFEPDLHSYGIEKAILVSVRVPILSRGRLSSDPKKYVVTHEVQEVKDGVRCLWSQLTSQVINEGMFNFRKEYEEGRVRDKRSYDRSTRRHNGDSH